MNDKSKQLKKMAIWTIVVFATIFAIVTTVLWMPLFNAGASAFAAIGQALVSGWLIYLIVAVLCFAAYFGYKTYLGRKK
jgi:amino acid transporter